MKININVLLAIAILILGISVSVEIQYLRNEARLNANTNEVNLIIANETSSIRQEIVSGFTSVEVLGSFFEKNDGITRKEFQNYTSPLYTGNLSIKAISWVPKITQRQRTGFESEIRNEHISPAFSITERNDKNKLISAASRPYYFPVKYIEPFNENINALGYDIFSDNTRSTTVVDAINTRKLTITPRIKLVQDSLDYSFLALLPVFYHSGPITGFSRIENVKGLVSTVFKVNQLINTALQRSKSVGIKLMVFDITTKKREQIYNNAGRIDKNFKIQRKQFYVADRVWELDFLVDPVLYKTDNKYSYFLIGISTSLFLSLLLLIPVIRTRRSNMLSRKLAVEQKVREQTEQSLLESKDYNRALFTQATIGLSLTTRDGRHMDANPAFAEIIGRTIDEILTLTYWEITPEKYAVQERHQLDMLDLNNHYGPYEKEYIHKDGHLVPVRLQGRIIDQEGVKYILSSIEDITLQKQAEEEIRNKQTLLMSFVNAIPDLLWLKDVNGVYLLCNANFEALYGVKQEHLIGKTDYELFEDKERADFFRETDKNTILLGKSTISEESVTFSSDGHQEVVETIKSPIYDHAGNITGVLGISRNITEHKKFESEIIRLNNHLHSLIEVIQQLTIARSLDEIMSSVRTAARKLADADGATFVLRDSEKCFYADEDAISPLWKGQRFNMDICISGWAMKHKEVVVIEDIYKDYRIPHEVYRPTFVNSLAMVPIRTKEPVGAIGIYWAHNYIPTDEQIGIVQALADATAIAMENVSFYEKLELKVKDRTALLEAANKELESFSYSVSHDLRAPLRHISGYIDLLNRRFPESLPEKGIQYLKNISASAIQMGLLIDDLLHFSRTSRQELRIDKLNMQILVQDVIKLIQQDNPGRKIDWITGQFPEVWGDHNLLKLVWINLLSNAVKFTRKCEMARIEINCHQEEKEYVFSVCDNGAGFDMQYAQKLFGVFQRLHTDAEYEGTGIGLANVKRIILRHGGRVWAQAEEGKGAIFYFTLPLNRN